MRWKTSQHHDPRHVDLMAVIALIVISVAAYGYFSRRLEVAPTTTLIVPSQSVRW